MDLFEEYLSKKKESFLIDRALTDKSYRNEYQRIYHKEYDGEVNTDLATYGDAVIKLCYCELLLDKVEKLTEEKAKYESDEYLVKYVAQHYSLVDHINKDKDNKDLPDDYDYEKYESNNHNKTKYIATAVEAMIGAIYKNTKDLNAITQLLKEWISFK